MHPAKTQVSLDIWLVWSEFWLSAQWVAKNSGDPHASSKDSGQPGHPISLICVWLSAQWAAKNSGVPHASNKDSDQPGHPISLIRDLTER